MREIEHQVAKARRSEVDRFSSPAHIATTPITHAHGRTRVCRSELRATMPIRLVQLVLVRPVMALANGCQAPGLLPPLGGACELSRNDEAEWRVHNTQKLSYRGPVSCRAGSPRVCASPQQTACNLKTETRDCGVDCFGASVAADLFDVSDAARAPASRAPCALPGFPVRSVRSGSAECAARDSARMEVERLFLFLFVLSQALSADAEVWCNSGRGAPAAAGWLAMHACCCS